MDYTIRVPSIYGDVVPLNCVAEAMARAGATAYGKVSFHLPAYANLMVVRRRQLLRAVANRRLKVCDFYGSEHDPCELAQKAKQFGPRVLRYQEEPDFQQLKAQYPGAEVGNGVWDFSTVGVELGPQELDREGTLSLVFHFKLLHLNEWGRRSGDHFCIDSNDVEWIDERGVMPTKSAFGSELPDKPHIDFKLLTTREKLIEAFGNQTGMDVTWFDNLKDKPALQAARKVTGRGGRSVTAPLFCPYEVMQWLINPKRRKGLLMRPETGWRILEQHFWPVYNANSVSDPRQD